MPNDANAVWVLGAAGRCGRVIAGLLASRGIPLVLVGRDPQRLRDLPSVVPALVPSTGGSGSGFGPAGNFRILAVDGLAAIVAELRRSKPAVVVNTIGPFATTAVPIARACTHYVDIGNELGALTDLLALNDEVTAQGRTVVAAAGFGATATECLTLQLCEGRPPASRVRVDALASVESAPGVVGEALAATILDAAAAGGRRYESGRLVRARLAGAPERLLLPDGTRATTVSAPSAELEAARHASGAPSVVAASSLLPAGGPAHALLPLAATLLSIAWLRRAATKRLARVQVTARKPEREHSWAHAGVQWPDGTRREGWLRAGDGMAFTTAAAAEVATRLYRGEGKPGVYTPGALFGPDLAVAAGAEFMID